VKKHFVDKECGMMNVNCQKLLNAFFLVATNKFTYQNEQYC